MNPDKLMRVLLVEDDPGDARLIQAMLPATEVAKFEITRTARLSEAITCLNQAPVDIVLLDLDLTVQSGMLHQTKGPRGHECGIRKKILRAVN